ncbi:MAG: DUF1573 domain-containing protein [Victivallales bacterium]|nr:DUF1573 domain-containing protein [Victivallales bacterium]
MKKFAFIVIGLCLSLTAAEDAYHKRLILPPCDAYGNSTGTVMLVNGGDRPVRLRHIRYSCGCLTGKSHRETIPPGGEAEIEFTLSPNGKGGQIRQKAWLEFEWEKKTGTVAEPVQTSELPNGLLLTNQVQVEFEFLLLSRLRLGLDVPVLDFNDEVNSTRTVQLTGSAKTASIMNVLRQDNSRFQYELSSDRRSLVVKPILDRRSPLRHISETWTLQTSDEQVPQLSLSLNLHVRHDFMVVPDTIELPSNGKLPLNGCLLIKPNNPRQKVKVSNAVWENAIGEIKIKELPHGLTRIAYTLEKISDKGKAVSLLIHTDSIFQEDVAVQIH